MKIASGKKWFTAVLAVLMVCVCALASAQSYSLGDEADEIETIQTALKKLKLYTGDITEKLPTLFCSHISMSGPPRYSSG